MGKDISIIVHRFKFNSSNFCESKNLLYFCAEILFSETKSNTYVCSCIIGA